MPVGNVELVPLLPIQGIKIATTKAHVRYPNRKDVTVFALCESAKTAVVTTQNQFCAAPVQWVRQFIQKENPRYLLINTGNANAATGEMGLQKAWQTCQALAEQTQVKTEQILPYSTGVIGEILPSEKIIQTLPDALANLDENHWLDACYGIMTTDTIPKGHSVQITCDDISYTVTGIGKGAGMIRPNMATMLAFVATDANIDPSLLQQMLVEITNQTFNRITIDGDTSTNDCCTLIATAKASDEVIDNIHHRHYQAIYQAIYQVMLKIAQLIVRDGEGATKFITVKVMGGENSQQCADVAYAVAHSLLVKTAFFASDPNWGRILAAVGNAGVALEQSQVNVFLDEVQICQRGGLAPTYTENQGQAVMSRPEITIQIELGLGQASDTVYTCDLSYDYVKINADYRS